MSEGMTQGMGMRPAALALAARGWRVFPVHVTVDGACSCRKAECRDTGKHPRISAWQKQATSDSNQIERWWQRWPDANIGVATGGGLTVVDLDNAEQLASFLVVAKTLPATLVARTGRGLHLYFSGDIGSSRKVDDILLRGAEGYVIAPPSLHASGNRYACLV